MELINDYERVDSYEELIGKEYAYTIVGNSIYFTERDWTWSYWDTVMYNRNIVYARDKTECIKENMCIDIPNIPSGYVGIEVYSGGQPGKLIAIYKK